MGEPLDDETVEVLWAVSVPQREAIRASGHFGSAEIQVPEDARSRRGCSDCSAAKRDGAADWVTRLGYPPAGRSKVARLARRD
jgi:hypothetical protein